MLAAVPVSVERSRIRLPLACASGLFVGIVAVGWTFAEIRTVPTLAMELLVSVVTMAWTLPVVGAGAAAAAALAVGLGVLLSGRAAIFRTTLRSAWSWAVAALVAWSCVEMFVGSSRFGALRLAAIGLSFCPIVALLGAKRPQDLAWNFVVFSLWGILALPAAEAFFLRGGNVASVGAVRGWFLWVLIMLGPINFVPTRYWLSAILLAAAQVIALGPYLAVVQQPFFRHAELVGLLLATTAMVAAWLIARWSTIPANTYDQQWLDFRDSFGLLWGLRVQERVNAAAKQYGWDLELTWGGFRLPSSNQPLAEINPEIEPVLRTTLKGLLRRFDVG